MDNSTQPTISPIAIEIRIAEKAYTVAHASPGDQPEQVHQITEQLYDPYRIESGSVSLAGCLLEEIPFLKMDWQVSAAEVSTQFFDQQGHLVTRDLAEQLGLDSLVALDSSPGHVNPEKTYSWLNPLAAKISSEMAAEKRELRQATIVWCKRAVGKMQIVIGTESATLPFTDWAVRLSRGTSKPPKFVCPRTGKESYHVRALEDGTLTVAEAIQTCGVTGKAVLETDLEPCAETGKLCLPTHLVECEVTGNRVMESARAKCSRCGQMAGIGQYEKKLCQTCKSLDRQVPFDAQRIDASRNAANESATTPANPLARLFSRRSKRPATATSSPTPENRPGAQSESRALILSGTEASAAALAKLQELVKENQGLKHWKQWRVAESDSRFVFRGENWLNAVEIAINKRSEEMAYLHLLNRVTRQRRRLGKRSWANHLSNGT